MNQTGYTIALSVHAAGPSGVYAHNGLPLAHVLGTGDYLVGNYGTARVAWAHARRLASLYGTAAVVTLIRFA